MLVRTTKDGSGRKRHSHILYIGPEGQGVTSINKDHVHLFSEETGIIEEADDHTHEIEGPPKPDKPRKPDKDDVELASRNRSLFLTAESYESDFRKKARESEKFYMGEQWTSKEKTGLGKKRAAITINEIEAKLDILSGYQRQNRTDIRFLPTEDGDTIVADILTQLVKNINNQNQYEHEEVLVFEDELICGRGLIYPYISYGRNFRGEIKVQRDEWDEVFFGPHNDFSADDAEYMFRAKKLSWAKVKELWPKKAKKIDQDVDLQQKDRGAEHTQHASDQYGKAEGEIPLIDAKFIDVAKKEYLVLEGWEKKYKNVIVLANVEDDFYERSDEWKEKDIEAIETIPGFRAINTIKTEMAVTITAGNVILKKYIDDEYDGEFPVIPIYAKKRKDKVWGKIENVKDPQRENNKRISQYTDLINKTAAYGWFIDDDTFDDDAQKNAFINNSAEPGFVLSVSDLTRPPVQVEGVKFPAEIVNLATIMAAKLREIMNVNPELQGLSTRAESGVAIAQKKMQGLIGNEYLFDNLSAGKVKLGKIYVKFIQKIYSAERIYRILGNQNRKEKFDLDGKAFTTYPEEVIIDLLNNDDLTQYDVTVSESAYNPTIRTANFIMWSEMAGKGVPVPPEMLIELSDLPEKEKWKEAMAKLKQEQLEEEQQGGKAPSPPQQ